MVGLDPAQVVQPDGHDQVLAAGEVLIHRRGLAGPTDHLSYGGWLTDHVEAAIPG